ncbi:MAG: aldehyde dehydrogenase family protein [Deltaproteobacteria bacterium]|nr:aldehyde dehydrogenase family protein [Deltaproteobacteria bacterium]
MTARQVGTIEFCVLAEISPLDGAPLGTWPSAGPREAEAAMARAREAFPSWAMRTVSDRAKLFGELAHLIVRELDAVVDAIVRSTGKGQVEALSSDVLATLDILHYYRKQAAAILAPQRRASSTIHLGTSFEVEWSPLGVVAVIAPWNLPFQLALVPAASALVAGNAVLLKPSERTPSIGALIGDLVRRAGFPEGVLQVVQGGGDTGRALIEARPDKVFFTGSTASGRKVMAAAAANLVPVELELGGKDPALVFADADFDRAVAGIAYGAFANTGQVCLSIERAYVERAIHDRFLEAVAELAAGLRVGPGPDTDLGPLILDRQREIVDAHLADALGKGATPVRPISREQGLYHPVVLRNATHAMKVMTEETFGPILPVMAFADEDEAVRLANDSAYGLGASVWTADLGRGRRVASRLCCGSVTVNDVLKTSGNPDAPFGGERSSGFGRYHGPEGLWAFSRQKTVAVTAGRLGREPNWFPHTPQLYQTTRTLVQTLYAGEGAFKKGARIAGSLFDELRRRLKKRR